MSENENIEVMADVDSEDLKVSGGHDRANRRVRDSVAEPAFRLLRRSHARYRHCALYDIISGVATFSVSAWNYWKNNSWRIPALVGDAVKDSYGHAAD